MYPYDSDRWVKGRLRRNPVRKPGLPDNSYFHPPVPPTPDPPPPTPPSPDPDSALYIPMPQPIEPAMLEPALQATESASEDQPAASEPSAPEIHLAGTDGSEDSGRSEHQQEQHHQELDRPGEPEGDALESEFDDIEDSEETAGAEDALDLDDLEALKEDEDGDAVELLGESQDHVGAEGCEPARGAGSNALESDEPETIPAQLATIAARMLPEPAPVPQPPRHRRLAADLRRHALKCQICSHPQREEIEADFLSWRSPHETAFEFKIARRAIYRHAAALDLFARRTRNMRMSLEHVIERAEETVPTAAGVVQAVRAYARLGQHGEWTEPDRRVHLLVSVEQSTPPRAQFPEPRRAAPARYALDQNSSAGGVENPQAALPPGEDSALQSPLPQPAIHLSTWVAAPPVLQLGARAVAVPPRQSTPPPNPSASAREPSGRPDLSPSNRHSKTKSPEPNSLKTGRPDTT